MNLKEQLLVEASRVNSDYIAGYIMENPEKFKELFNIITAEKPPVSLRASWVASIISDSRPDILLPFISKIIPQLKHFKHPGIRRNILRYLATIDIPEELAGNLLDDCYKWLLSREEPLAVKVHSMQIIYNISQNEPDLLRELKITLEGFSDHESGAIQSRTKELLKKLSRL